MEDKMMEFNINDIKNPLNLSVSKKYNQYDNVEHINVEQKNKHIVV